MASKVDKGKEGEIINKGLKRLRKGSKGPKFISHQRNPTRRFGAKTVLELGLGYVFVEREECNLTL
ncbi:hypothetical protein HAX54_008748, partial [Datura stramonium]|nr:hypothetical protein [Datura stramonium]